MSIALSRPSCHEHSSAALHRRWRRSGGVWSLAGAWTLLAGLSTGGLFDLGVVPAANANPPSGAVTSELSDLLGFTVPLQRSTLASPQTGRVAAVHVGLGARVRTGDVLVQLEDDAQRARVAIAEALAASDLEIRVAQTRLEQSRSELSRLEGLELNRAATAKELIDSRAELQEAELELSLAQFRREQAARDAALQRAVLNEYQIRAPFDGYVSEKLHDVGETIEPGDGILTIVRVDSLDVVVDCPIGHALTLQPDQVALVTCAARRGDVREARVAFVNRVADAASQTTKVRLRLDNPGLEWPAGAAVVVRFGTAAEDAKRGAADESGRRVGGSTAQAYEPLEHSGASRETRP